MSGFTYCNADVNSVLALPVREIDDTVQGDLCVTCVRIMFMKRAESV